MSSMRNGLSTSEAGKLGAIKSAETAALEKKNRIEAWNNNPKLCKFCNTPISYDKRRNDFCNHSCGANYLNQSKGYTLADDKLHNCLFCKQDFKAKGTVEHKYCSRDCMTAFWWQETKTELVSTGIDNSNANRIGKKYLIELYQGKCQLCSLDHWQGNQMPLVLDHIDGNAYNNLLSNLRVICNNCDALQPTFKSKNKGNGRFKRAERYKYEKEHLKDTNFKH